MFFKILSFNSFNCVHTLQRRLVAYSLSLSYYSEFLASKTAKNFCIPFSSTVLYFDNLGAKEEGVFFVLLSFFAVFKRGRATKIRLNEIYFYFTSFSNISNSSILRFVIFIHIFSVRLFYTKLTQNNISNTQVFYLLCCILKCTHKQCSRFFESHYTFYTYSISQILYYILLLTHMNLKKHNASRQLPGVVLQSWKKFSHKKSY